jgi:transposase
MPKKVMADKYKKRGDLTCSEKEKEQLEKISKSKSEEYRKVQRARVFLLYMEHTPVAQISKEVGLSRESVYSVLDKAFAFGPIAGLEDLSGRGVSPVISDEDKAWVIHLACSSPREYGYSYEVWTYRLLVGHIQKTCEAEGYPKLKNAGKSLLHGILDKAGIKPHKITYYLEKRDENFEEKMAQVLAVYKEIQLTNIQEEEEKKNGSLRKYTTISYDEKPGIQAIKNIAPQLLPVPGKHKTLGRDYEYKRLGTVSLLAGIDLHNGMVIPQVEDRHRSAEFTKYLKKLIDHYPDDWKIRLILDNHSAHRSKETMKFLDTVPGKFEFVFTPTHGSWLNMIEMFFSKITRSFLRHIRVESKAELKQRIYQGIEEINQEPVVFKWKYKIEEEEIETTQMSS